MYNLILSSRETPFFFFLFSPKSAYEKICSNIPLLLCIFVQTYLLLLLKEKKE